MDGMGKPSCTTGGGVITQKFTGRMSSDFNDLNLPVEDHPG